MKKKARQGSEENKSHDAANAPPQPNGSTPIRTCHSVLHRAVTVGSWAARPDAITPPSLSSSQANLPYSSQPQCNPPAVAVWLVGRFRHTTATASSQKPTDAAALCESGPQGVLLQAVPGTIGACIRGNASGLTVAAFCMMSPRAGKHSDWTPSAIFLGPL